MNPFDLHLHSNYSDSDKSIFDLLREARDKQMKVISISDHDTLKAYEELKDRKLPCSIVKGIELSTFDGETGSQVHILGYGLGEDTSHIERLCQSTLYEMQKRSLWQIDQLLQHGYEFDPNEVFTLAKNSTSIYKQHIMQVLIQHGYSDTIYSKVYRSLFKNGGICEKRISLPDPESAIQAIHQDGGIAILAHPFISHIDHELQRFVRMGIDGVESGHSSHTADQRAYLHEKALRYELLESGGSDDHGTYGEEPKMGCYPLWQGGEELLCKVKCWR